MIYTCYEMARDCRAGKVEGWAYFIAHYVPAIRKIIHRYKIQDRSAEDVVAALYKGCKLFESEEAVPERWFLVALRQAVMSQIPVRSVSLPLDLDTVAAALEPLTVVEKSAAWLESMHYTPAEIGAMMRMAPSTVEKIRSRAGELLRGQSDAWRSTILEDNGLSLGQAAAGAGGKECLPPRDFADILEGRTTWPQRDRMTRHVTACWHCIDHFCRMIEAGDLLRGAPPLSAEESAPYFRRLGIAPPGQKPVWKRLFGG